MKQISIITQSRDGLTASISETLAVRGINITTLDAHEVKGMDVVTLIVDRYDEALQALRDAGFDAVTEDAVLIRVKDEPGALARVARRLKDAGIHMRSLRIISQNEGWGVVAISMDRNDEALALIENLILPMKP